MSKSPAPKQPTAKAKAPQPAPAAAPVSHRRWIIPASISAGSIVLAGLILATIAYTTQAKTIVKSTTIAGVDVGGMTTLEAATLLQQRWDEFLKNAYRFSADGSIVTISPSAESTDETEVVLDLAGFDAIASANAAYAFGHDGPLYWQIKDRVSGWLGRRHEFGNITFSRQALTDILEDKLEDNEAPAKDAGLAIAENGTATVTPSSQGSSFDYDTAIRKAYESTRTLNSAIIVVNPIVTQPSIASSAQLQAVADAQVSALLARAPMTLTLGEQRFPLDAATLRSLLGFARVDGEIAVGFDAAKTAAYLETLRPEVDIAPKNAKFSIDNGKVKEFQTSVVGRTLDVPATIAAMNAELAAGSSASVALVVTEEQPLTDEVPTNNLGITELVAEGVTNFRGSPVNRRYNLSLGAERLHGLLIKPGETFSLISALGKIDGAHGWKPELVIKQGGRITPEFGGGLCQVATTLFRAVLNAGLPVVERTNHSLRISYYEPPIGLDATIYEPKPDFRFRNDFDSHLLLQTEVRGDELVFRIYGTKDGRTVDLPTPRVYNQVPIPATRTIEVTDLPPGKKECQAPGHPGADATATYTVTKADGTKVTQVFQSHYRAIGVICRVGKAKTTTKKD